MLPGKGGWLLFDSRLFVKLWQRWVGSLELQSLRISMLKKTMIKWYLITTRYTWWLITCLSSHLHICWLQKEHLKNEYNRIEASQVCRIYCKLWLCKLTVDKQGSSQSITNDDSKFSQQLLNHRSCHNCGRFVLGNGVRKPLCEVRFLILSLPSSTNLHLHQLEYPDHDIIYCHKQCFFENEFQKKVS